MTANFTFVNLPVLDENTEHWRHCIFDKARGKDIIVDSPFTRAIKFCQEELQRSRLPFWFVSALQYFPTSDPVRLKLACRAAQGGAYYADIIRILMSA